MMFELGLVCPESSVQDISDALEALDALSVSVEDADAQSDAERALFGEPGMPPPKEAWQRSKVVALFAKEAMALDAERLLFVQDFFANKGGFTPMVVPSLVRREPFMGTGYLPQSEEDLYKTQDNDYLSGTAEVATMGYFMDEVLDKKDLPKKLLSTLAQPGAGQKYVQVDDNVLLISEGTKMILDAIGAVK